MVPPYTVEWLMERNNMFHNFTDVLSRVSGLSGMEIINTNNTNMRWRGDYIEEAEILSDVEIRENGRYDGTKYESADEKEEKLKQRKKSIKMVEAEAANIDCRVFIEGPKYKNRPIIWVVNNDYNCTTGFSGRYCEVEEMPQGLNGTFIFPMLFEDVKSIYISEDQDIIRNYIQSQMLDNQRPVIVFIYRHYDIKNKDKGVRRTYFQGYNVPSTFEMEDYTDLPPMEDFRRTIFWEPNVKTDKDGKAKIEFFNNSSCTQMYISAEGMTKEGRFIVNE
jgi:hypothetical protein